MLHRYFGVNPAVTEPSAARREDLKKAQSNREDVCSGKAFQQGHMKSMGGFFVSIPR